MPNWNPNFPEILGLEFLGNHNQQSRVFGGAPGRAQRLTSTVAETITGLKLSAAVDPLLRASTRTVVDIIPEGSEVVPLFTFALLAPNSDIAVNGWRTNTGASTSLFQAINEDPTEWSHLSPAYPDWIQSTTSSQTYECSVDAALFDTGGSAQNGRIGFVSVEAILGANTGFRKLRTSIIISGTEYQPAGGSLRDVHGYGATVPLWYGELNPSTGLPWKPADIAQFRIGGNSKIRVVSQTATATHFPKVWALALGVWYTNTENRVAAAVWRRPPNLTSRLNNVTTDALITLPGGAANWAKPASGNFLFYWRQSVTPALYGPVNADDVRWNGLYQDLGPLAQPAGTVYPLTTSGTAPPAAGTLASDRITYDAFGRPTEAFDAESRATYGLALVRSDAANSVDSMPYRLDIVDVGVVKSTQKLGQRITPASSQTYLGVRAPVIPPGTGNPTLTIAVHRVSDGVQMGGTFTITASAARALTGTATGWKFVNGFLSSGASLVGGTAYEIRFTTTSGGDWLVPAPDASLANNASFGGSTNGAFIGTTHFPDRDVAVTIVRQPDPPTNVVASIVNIPITTYASTATTVQHVNLAWTLPAVGMGGLFARYEIERQFDNNGIWQRVANVVTSSLNQFRDHEVPRNVAAQYRIRAVGTDGRFSNWATSGTVTPATTGSLVILTSNHDRTLEAVYLHDRESSYPLLSGERDEVVSIHGADYQVVFMEAEDRGVGWRTQITLWQITDPVDGGHNILNPLLNLVRATTIPYVCVLDRQGTRIMGHVKISDATQRQPGHRYSVQIDVIPTHSEPEPVTLT